MTLPQPFRSGLEPALSMLSRIPNELYDHLQVSIVENVDTNTVHAAASCTSFGAGDAVSRPHASLGALRGFTLCACTRPLSVEFDYVWWDALSGLSRLDFDSRDLNGKIHSYTDRRAELHLSTDAEADYLFLAAVSELSAALERAPERFETALTLTLERGTAGAVRALTRWANAQRARAQQILTRAQQLTGADLVHQIAVGFLCPDHSIDNAAPALQFEHHRYPYTGSLTDNPEAVLLIDTQFDSCEFPVLLHDNPPYLLSSGHTVRVTSLVLAVLLVHDAGHDFLHLVRLGPDENPVRLADFTPERTQQLLSSRQVQVLDALAGHVDDCVLFETAAGILAEQGSASRS